MQARTKKSLQAEIKNKSLKFDEETDQIDRDVYQTLAAQLLELERKAKDVKEEKADLDALAAELAAFDTALSNAKSEPKPAAAASSPDTQKEAAPSSDPQKEAVPTPDPQKESVPTSDPHKEVAPTPDPQKEAAPTPDQEEATATKSLNQLSYAVEYYEALMYMLSGSRNDNDRLAEICAHTKELDNKLIAFQKALEKQLDEAAKHNATLVQNRRKRLEDTTALFTAMKRVKAYAEDAEKGKYDGCYTTTESVTDKPRYVNSVDEAQKLLLEYFDRKSEDNIEIESANGDLDSRMVRSLRDQANLAKVHFIPSLYQNDKKESVRYGMIQEHLPEFNTFRSIVKFQVPPANLPVETKDKISIPGQELMTIAHDVIENHRLKNGFYTQAGMKIKFGSKISKELKEAIVLYCMHMEYAFQCKEFEELKIGKPHLDLLGEMLESRKINLGQETVYSEESIAGLVKGTETEHKPPTRRM